MSKGNGELAMRLVKAESAAQVEAILRHEGYWDDESVWRNYGDKENNWGTGNNQQAHAEGALVEKIINSVDAVLMRECLLRNINPEDPEEAPQGIYSAVEDFFDVPSGTLEKLSSAKRRQISENIQVVATGEKSSPCIHVIDKGEGQTPNDFPRTFMSLHESNKIRINFVQGRYNMGGTGALLFCRNGLQLVLSRRHPEIAKHETSNPTRNHWGFTIVRLFPPKGNMKNSVLKYLAPGNEVLSFQADSVEVLPATHPNAYGRLLEWGTFIKLYDYNLPSTLKSNIRMNLYFKLSFLLPRIALPIRMYEMRDYDSSHYDIVLTGHQVRLADDKAKNLEAQFPKTAYVGIGHDKVKCTIYLFRDEISKAYGRSTERVAFTLNGQTQGWFSKRLLQARTGFDYLADSLMVLVDCTNLDRVISEQLFMGSRDRFRVTDFHDELRDELFDMLESHPDLKRINNERRKKAIQKRGENAKPLYDVLKKIRKKSPGLDFLLNPGKKLHTPFDLRRVDSQEQFEGEIWPTFFKLISDEAKEVPLGSNFYMYYETDAENTYLDRGEKPGQFFLFLNDEKTSYNHLSLSNGRATLKLTTPPTATVGDELHYSSRVIDALHEENPMTDAFTIHIVEQRRKGSAPSGKPASPRGGEEGSKRWGPDLGSIPEIVSVRREDWDDYGFDEFSALLVRRDGEGGYDFYVNVHNHFLLDEIKARSSSDPEEIEQDFKFGMALIGMSLLLDDPRLKIDLNDNYEMTILEMIPEFTKAISPVIIPLIRDF